MTPISTVLGMVLVVWLVYAKENVLVTMKLQNQSSNNIGGFIVLGIQTGTLRDERDFMGLLVGFNVCVKPIEPLIPPKAPVGLTPSRDVIPEDLFRKSTSSTKLCRYLLYGTNNPVATRLRLHLDPTLDPSLRLQVSV